MQGQGNKQQDSSALRIFCTQCGKPMRVAPEHAQTPVACPYCANVLEPWRIPGHAPVPPPVPPNFQPAAPRHDSWAEAGWSSRNRMTAGLLGVFLGWIGVHRFYLGHHWIGVLQIVLTSCTAVAGLWGIIEGILCLTGRHLNYDADGYPLREQA